MSADSGTKHFFLNERHELSKSEKAGGGGIPKYEGINWAQKGKKIQQSVLRTRSEYLKGPDPLKESHYFFIATPDLNLKKKSEAKGTVSVKADPADFSSTYSQVFHRLGLDLIRLSSDGKALVHMTPERMEAIDSITSNLGEKGKREQARWAAIEEFQPVPWFSKVNQNWLQTIETDQIDVIMELQPLLQSAEVDRLLGEVVKQLSRFKRENISGSGTDYSGRRWFRAKLGSESIKNLAESFHSIQSLHSPLGTEIQSDMLAGWSETLPTIYQLNDPSIGTLPTVGILDTGVEEGHVLLGPYLRNRYIAPQSIQTIEGSHGSQVASKIVFGHCNPTSAHGLLTDYRCKYLDVVITKDALHIEDKAVVPALEAAIANFRDVRVFNFSFGDKYPIEDFEEQDRLEKLAQLRDLDNLIFSEDVAVVVAAGNSAAGLIPNPNYPQNYEDPKWRLPAWARGFNTIVCGAFVDELRDGALTNSKGLPSPFTRVGPGMASAPVPGFCEHGGDVNATYNRGFGVAVCDRYGNWKESCGTSYASPLLARKIAHIFLELKKYCTGSTRPYTCLVKSFLAASARRPDGLAPKRIKELSNYTLGRGEVDVDLLFTPNQDKAFFFWQGTLDSPNEIVRVQIPIPQEWLKRANDPKMRTIWSWETPVHDGIHGVWGCRRVDVKIKAGPDGQAIRGTVGDFSHPSYTTREKIIKLNLDELGKKNIRPNGDIWLLEINYEQLADYYPGREFSLKQRVGLVVELFDEGFVESPRAYVQAMSIAPTFDRLSISPAPLATPVRVKV